MPSKIELFHGDCLEVMRDIPDGSVDMILCDLPYGTTRCAWDVIIPFDPLWEQYKRIIKPSGAIVLFGQEPFSSLMRAGNIGWFKYDWYWKKSRPSGFVNCNLKPLKDIEIISVFSNGTTANGSKTNMPYNPQGTIEINKQWNRPKRYYGIDSGIAIARESHGLTKIIKNENYPRQILEFPNGNKNLLHPTQKPVALCEYLIRTYTNEGKTVLDNCMGSGTTGIACLRTMRNFIGIEKEEKYFNIATERIRKEQDDIEQSLYYRACDLQE